MFVFNRGFFGKLAFFFFVCFLLGFSAAFGMQAPNDTYDVGPDPLADDLKQPGKDQASDDLLGMDIEQLANAAVVVPAMNITVESVSRTTRTLARTSSAVYVVTNEMIRRCGARNIPEVLRTVPGVNVARINTCAWAISIRGMNGRQAGMLLVQIDGVAIYNPLHSGVFWERNHVMLEDVERIEVIRGPGASVWGANAVNGIINIVTKSSKKTEGVYASVGGGNEHRQFSNFRVGNQIGKNFTWRVYGRNMDDGPGIVPAPDEAIDSQFYGQGGFRTDWTPTRQDTITVQGDFFRGTTNQEGYITPPATTSPRTNINTTLLTRWTRKVDEDTDWALQAYYFDPYSTNAARSINTGMFDLDFQCHMSRGRHDIVWGFGYRNNDEYITAGTRYPDTEQIPSYFVQDTIEMVDNKFFLTLGSKFDHNSVTHFEYQPMAKATWTPDKRTSIWGGVSRAVRTPALLDRIFEANRLYSEDAISYEIGVRRQPNDKFFWELATFYTRYNHLIAGLGFPNRDNVGRGETYGFEWNMCYEVTEHWQLTTWYAFLVEDLYYPTGYTPVFNIGGAPRNEFYFQSGWDFAHDISLDVMIRYVDSLAAGVEEYVVADIRCSWRPTKCFELSVVGQNLLNGDYYEFTDSAAVLATKTQPGVYGMATWRY
ncbi:MAG: TonB-dependent receptor plug domain-containing protein [Planctomycetia bacterium]|jgi:iron complex outermembrane receptor protein